MLDTRVLEMDYAPLTVSANLKCGSSVHRR